MTTTVVLLPVVYEACVTPTTTGNLVTCASDLQWPPGTWPLHIVLISDEGKKTIMHRETANKQVNDDMGYAYTTNESNRKLKVFND